MQEVNQKAVQGSAGYSLKGLVLKLSTAALGAVCCLAPMTPMGASAGDTVSHLKFLQVMAQLTGDSGQFSTSSKPADYLQWARSKNLTVSWSPTDVLTSDQVAVTLVQLYGLSPRRYGGDVYKTLEREGINIQKSGVMTGVDLSSIIDSSAFANRAGALAAVSTSPNKPGQGHAFGLGWFWLNENVNQLPPGSPQKANKPKQAR